jgi:hypothetical protein
MKDDYVSMNFWLCRSNFFNYLNSYIEKTMDELEDIEKDEIYLPFACATTFRRQYNLN